MQYVVKDAIEEISGKVPPSVARTRVCLGGVRAWQCNRPSPRPTPSPGDSRTALFQRCGESNTGVYVGVFYFLVSHQSVSAAWVDRYPED